MSERTVHTLGHGARTFDELIDCLRSFEISVVVDVRSYPASRHHPHFDRDALEPALAREGIRFDNCF